MPGPPHETRARREPWLAHREEKSQRAASIGPEIVIEVSLHEHESGITEKVMVGTQPRHQPPRKLSGVLGRE